MLNTYGNFTVFLRLSVLHIRRLGNKTVLYIPQMKFHQLKVNKNRYTTGHEESAVHRTVT